MKQRGFLLAGMLPYLAIGAGAIILVLSLALWFQGTRLDKARASLATETANHKLTKGRYEAFTTDVKVKGEAAAIRAKEQAVADQKAKEKADEYAKLLYANLAVAERKLRDAGARARTDSSRSILPATQAAAKRPDRITFDRAELDRALRAYFGEEGALFEDVAGLVIEGEKGRVELDNARRWAQERGL